MVTQLTTKSSLQSVTKEEQLKRVCQKNSRQSSKFPKHDGKYPSGSESGTASPSQGCNHKHGTMALLQQRLLGPGSAGDDTAARADAAAKGSRSLASRGRRGGRPVMARAPCGAWLVLCLLAGRQWLTGRTRACPPGQARRLLRLANLAPSRAAAARRSATLRLLLPARSVAPARCAGTGEPSPAGLFAAPGAGTHSQTEHLLLCWVAGGGFSWVSPGKVCSCNTVCGFSNDFGGRKHLLND